MTGLRGGSCSDSSSASNGSTTLSISDVRVLVSQPMLNDNKHVLYQMEVTFCNKTWNLLRRYSEFYKLYDLVSIHGDVNQTSCQLFSFLLFFFPFSDDEAFAVKENC